MNRIEQKFFDRSAVEAAKDLLGCYLTTKIDGETVTGKIVETEAYFGEDDLGCHASRGRTERTEILFGPPGHLYIYLNYGIFYLTNVVCKEKDFPAAILLRAAEITKGQETASERLAAHKFVKDNKKLATGPGKLSIAFGINKSLNGIDLAASKLVEFFPRKKTLSKFDIISTERVGIDYAKHCKNYLWRFYIRDNEYVSKRI